MPPKTRGSKTTKASNENIGVTYKTKTKTTSRVAKLPRKALADKTNSASDDNASLLPSKPSVNIASKEEISLLSKQRPRRERRIPSRYVETNGIQNVSESNIASVEKKDISKRTPSKIPTVVLSPLKNSKISLDSSLSARRPKRVCRLPSKFDDHSISPSKFIPVQPAYASTPKVVTKPTKKIEKKDSSNKGKTKKALSSDKVKSVRTNIKKTVHKKNNDTSNKTNSPNSSADTNNNAKSNQLPHSYTKNKQNTSPKLLVTSTKSLVTKKLDKNNSQRILDSKKKTLKRDASNLDVYEFTYDPNEEPPPQKKKRKRPAKKREPRPKKVVFMDNYDKNLAKALTNLKKTINNAKADVPKVVATQSSTTHPVTNTVVTTVDIHPTPSNPCTSEKSYTSVINYNSVRVEDIALDFEQDSYADNINYSPVHSMCPPTMAVQNNVLFLHSENVVCNSLSTPVVQNCTLNQKQPAFNNDPLNLRDDLSFFEDQPVASSSMNVSTRNPAASPWRVEFGKLPIKWQVNTYVKPNMTPAFECSFMNFNDSKKKHVYTNMVPEAQEENDLPQIYEDYGSKLKQTSIISFIKEVVDKKEKKKREKMTPIKNNSLFEDVNNASAHTDLPLVNNNYTTPKKSAQTNVQSNEHVTSPNQHESNMSNESHKSDKSKESDKENSEESVKGSSTKKRGRNVTYFGFDDSENHDQENVSPVKKVDKRKLRALKPRGRAVLQEINEQRGPTRAMLPVAVKSKPIQNSEVANKLFDEMKAATEPPVFPDKDPVQSMEITNITEADNIDPNDDQSVHLFEDIELIHHFKAHRKSYGKAKKAVTFRQNSISDSDVPASDVAEQSASSDEDDLHDLTFKMPEIEPKKTTRKKKSKKPKFSKKEEKEVEEWAAGFNSMCEDIEEFDLVVE